jgi:hypothetical protein
MFQPTAATERRCNDSKSATRKNVHGNVPRTAKAQAVEKLDDRLTAVESKIGGIHNRIDDEALTRANLETRVRSAVPSLPPPPERV